MKVLLNLLILCFTQNLLSQIYINEIFPAPNPNQSEWVEILNPNETEITLYGMVITSRGKSLKIDLTITLEPQSFLILTKDTLGFEKSLVCKYLVVQLPTLHNDWDEITIRTRDSLLIDSAYYNSSLVRKGFSIERIDWSEAGYILSNWSICTDTNQHTMCLNNSKSIKDFNLIHQFDFNEGNGYLKLYNGGRKDISNISIISFLKLKVNGNSEERKFIENHIDKLNRKDSITIELPIKKFIADNNYDILENLIIEIKYDSLKQIATRKLIFPLGIPYPFKSVLVNEFLFDVYPGCGEFIELINISNDTLSLKYWKLINSSNKELFFDDDKSTFQIEPNNFWVIVWDSAFFNCFEYLTGADNIFCLKGSFSLRNTGDKILLVNPIGLVQDSLSYFPEWHKGKLTSYKQRSLEKMIPVEKSYLGENWYTCVDPRGATPGEINSVSIEKGEKISIDVEPSTFSPTSLNNEAKIIYKLPYKQARINVKIFDLGGIEVYTLANNQITSSAGEIVWNGDTNFGKKASPGGYVIFLEAIDIISGEVTTGKTTIGVGW